MALRVLRAYVARLMPVLVCDQCGVRVGIPRRRPICPYCTKETTWQEPLTRKDEEFLASLKIATD